MVECDSVAGTGVTTTKHRSPSQALASSPLTIACHRRHKPLPLTIAYNHLSPHAQASLKMLQQRQVALERVEKEAAQNMDEWDTLQEGHVHHSASLSVPSTALNLYVSLNLSPIPPRSILRSKSIYLYGIYFVAILSLFNPSPHSWLAFLYLSISSRLTFLDRSRSAYQYLCLSFSHSHFLSISLSLFSMISFS